ncbi:MAG: hypothetical protein IPI54_15780 [Chitinophagaceae bacterium]|nr:hypothetical protein [Chitinophagaceae bacterium]
MAHPPLPRDAVGIKLSQIAFDLEYSSVAIFRPSLKNFGFNPTYFKGGEENPK